MGESPIYGKYGLPLLDEYAIEALAGCLERLPNGGEQDRLRHALAAFLIRAQTSTDTAEGEG